MNIPTISNTPNARIPGLTLRVFSKLVFKLIIDNWSRLFVAWFTLKLKP